VKLQEMSVIEQSETLLDGLGHEAVGLQLGIEKKLAAIAAPGVAWRMESGRTGWLQAVAGKRRDFLRIDFAPLSEYSVLISARPFGTALHVCWLLFASPRLANDVRRALRLDAEPGTRFDVGSELDLLDRWDLGAFVAATRLALRSAIRELTEATDEDDQSFRAD
jgi:hypothetical protein